MGRPLQSRVFPWNSLTLSFPRALSLFLVQERACRLKRVKPIRQTDYLEAGENYTLSARCFPRDFVISRRSNKARDNVKSRESDTLFFTSSRRPDRVKELAILRETEIEI